MNNAQAAGLLAIGLLGCGGTKGTDLHDMSAAQHDRTAGAEETAAKQPGHQLDPSSTTKFLNCNDSAPCWTSTAHSSDPHKIDMARHRELAAKHRVASQALRDAEAKACMGLQDDERDMSPFRHGEDIASVTELTRRKLVGKVVMDVPYGGRAVFRAVPGLTETSLRRIVSCHMARAAALGHNVPGMEYCPLTLKDVTAAVTSASDGLAIEITSSDQGVSREVMRRIHAAASRHTAGSTPNSKEGS